MVCYKVILYIESVFVLIPVFGIYSLCYRVFNHVYDSVVVLRLIPLSARILNECISVLLVECIYGSLNPSVTRIYVLVFLVGLFGVYRAEYTRGQREFSQRGRERLGVGQSGTSSSVNHVVKSRRNRDF